MSTKGKGSYVVMLEQAKLPPKLIAGCKPVSGVNNKYHVYLIHPNTKKVIVEREVECKDIGEAMKKANELRDLPEAQNIETWYEETLFIPQPKRGKMKLKTKQAVEEEMNAEPMDDDMDESPVKAAPKAPNTAKSAPAAKAKPAKKAVKTKAVKAKKTINKPAKSKKKKK